MKYGQANNLEDGDALKSFSGKIKSIYPSRAAGRSTVQNLVVTTSDGDVKVALWGQTIDESKKGSPITITPTNVKFGEVVYKINEYDGKKGHVIEEVIDVQSKAKLLFDNNNSQKSETKPQSKGFNEEELIAVAEALTHQHKIVDSIVRLAYEGYAEATLQAYTATIFLEANVRGFIANSIAEAKTPEQPSKPQESNPGASYDPSDWANAIIPSGTHQGKKLVAAGKEVIFKMQDYALQNKKEGGFWSCVDQAAKDLGYSAEEQDDIPF